jgi:hypothetical protein
MADQPKPGTVNLTEAPRLVRQSRGAGLDRTAGRPRPT